MPRASHGPRIQIPKVMTGSPHLETTPPFWTGHPASTPYRYGIRAADKAKA
jgi:hypothetical protein